MAEPGANLSRIVNALAAMSGGAGGASRSEIRDLFAEDVFWQGLEPGLYCGSRKEVLGMLLRHLGTPPRLSRFDAAEVGEAVVVTVDGPDFQEPGPTGLTGPRRLRFDFKDGRISRIESLAPVLNNP